MKKILLALVSVVTVLFLVACSGSQSMDGEYHEFVIASNTGELGVNDESGKIVIEGDSGTRWGDDMFSIDKDRKTLVFSYGEYPYTYENNTLTYDGDTYIKVGSKEYKEKMKEIEEQKKD